MHFYGCRFVHLGSWMEGEGAPMGQPLMSSAHIYLPPAADTLPELACPRDKLICALDKVNFSKSRALGGTYRSCKTVVSSLFGRWFPYTTAQQALNVFENKCIE